MAALTVIEGGVRGLKQSELITITEQCGNIFFHSPAHVPLNMFNHLTKTAQVRIFPIQCTYHIFLDFTFFVGCCHSAKLNIRITGCVTFKRIWHYICNIIFTCERPCLQRDSLDDGQKTLSKWEVRKSFQNYSALTLRIVFLWVTHLSLAKRLFDHSTRIDQFPYFRIQPQTIRVSWE